MSNDQIADWKSSTNADPSKAPIKLMLEFPPNAGSSRSFSFEPYRNKGFDDILYHCFLALKEELARSIATNGQSRSVSTIAANCYHLKKFFEFCTHLSSNSGSEIAASEIDERFIAALIRYLNNLTNLRRSQRVYYSAIKSVLTSVARNGVFSAKVFPKNPYPKSKSKLVGQKKYSKEETTSLIRSLRIEIDKLSSGSDPLTSYELSTCIAVIALRTGLNPTPILELSEDCLQDHPLKPNQKLLVSYKRRGNNTLIQSHKGSKTSEAVSSATTTVVDIINLIIRRNASCRLSSDSPSSLFVYKSKAARDFGNPTLLTLPILTGNLKKMAKKHNLRSDDGEDLTMNIMRLRKTFVNRIWELSDQDPFVTASLAGHSVKVSDTHYLDAPVEATTNWRLMGEIMVKELTSTTTELEKTPVASCRDPVHGHRAPKNGTHCTSFLSCFRCQSFVVTRDDLYRIFSLYWMIVRERDQLGSRTWKRFYSNIVRVIDEEISPRFEEHVVTSLKEKAKSDPHPFWATNAELLESSTWG